MYKVSSSNNLPSSPQLVQSQIYKFSEFGWTLQWTGSASAPTCWWSTTKTSWLIPPENWSGSTGLSGFRWTLNGSSASGTIRTTSGNVRRRIWKDSKSILSKIFIMSFDSAILQVQNELIARGHKLIPIERYLHTKIYL